MKISKLLPVLFFFSILIVSCEKDPEEELKDAAKQVVNPSGNFLNATVDGSSFEADLVNIQEDSSAVIIIGITASGAFPSFTISVPSNASTGTVNFPADTANVPIAVTYAINDSVVYFLNSGQFNLTTYDKTNKLIEGTFQGTLYRFSAGIDSLSVNNGSVKASYN